MAKEIESIVDGLHPSLSERLKLAHNKPVMITVTYMNSKRRLQHWVGCSGRFVAKDVDLSLNNLRRITKNDLEGNIHA